MRTARPFVTQSESYSEFLYSTRDFESQLSVGRKTTTTFPKSIRIDRFLISTHIQTWTTATEMKFAVIFLPLAMASYLHKRDCGVTSGDSCASDNGNYCIDNKTLAQCVDRMWQTTSCAGLLNYCQGGPEPACAVWIEDRVLILSMDQLI